MYIKPYLKKIDDIISKPSPEAWSQEEDKKLAELVKTKFLPKNLSNSDTGSVWSEITSSFYGRSEIQCRARWTNHLRPMALRTYTTCTYAPWTVEEDMMLSDLIRWLPKVIPESLFWFVIVKNKYFKRKFYKIKGKLN